MYKLMGADQREYGPVESQTVREWIAQGRANAQTLASFEGAPWKPLSAFPEFADALRSSAPPPFAPPPADGGQMIVQRSNTVAIAGLVFSVLGWCCLPFSLVGLVLSIAGLLQIQKSPHSYTTPKIVPIIGIVLSLLYFATMIAAWSTGVLDEMMRRYGR